MPAHTPRDSALTAQTAAAPVDTTQSSAPDAPGAKGPAAAIRLLAARGYEATTAEDLADAVGVSRSTFFRRFGSKDDVIFADHDLALAALEVHLAQSNLSPSEALIAGTCDVLRLLTRDPEAARLRFALVRQHGQLKERELVITHRYQRVFARYLRTNLSAETPTWVAATFAAALVALHNQTLRDWLRDEVTDAPAALGAQLREVATLYDAWLTPAVSQPAADRATDAATGRATDRATASRVVVAVYEAGSTPDEVLAAVAAQLGK